MLAFTTIDEVGMGLHQNEVKLALALLIVLMGNLAKGADDKDKEECAEQLTGLATCLPYVGGNAKTPTPDCCSGLKQVLKDNKKCLCVVIKDRNDPDLGLNINVTLALGLPTVCHASANVSQCPVLLHLPPNSPDAQVFYQFAKGSGQSASSPALSPGDVGNPSSAPSQGQNAQPQSGGHTNSDRWFGLEIFSSVFIVWYSLHSHLFI